MIQVIYSKLRKEEREKIDRLNNASAKSRHMIFSNILCFETPIRVT